MLRTPVSAICSPPKHITRRGSKMESPTRPYGNLCFVLKMLYFFLSRSERRRREVKKTFERSLVRSILPAFTVVSLHATQHRLCTSAGREKTCLLDAKTENRRIELRVFALAYLLHSGVVVVSFGFCMRRKRSL